MSERFWVQIETFEDEDDKKLMSELIKDVIENQKYKYQDFSVVQHSSGDLRFISKQACKNFIKRVEGDEIDDLKKKVKIIAEKCLKVKGLFDSLMDEEGKMTVVEDKNETYIVVFDEERTLHIVKRQAKKVFSEVEIQEIRRNNKLIITHRDEVGEYLWEFNDNAAFS